MESKEKKEQSHIQYSYLYSIDGYLSYEESECCDKVGAFIIVYENGEETSRDAFVSNDCWVWVSAFADLHAAKKEAVRLRREQYESSENE